MRKQEVTPRKTRGEQEEERQERLWAFWGQRVREAMGKSNG